MIMRQAMIWTNKPDPGQTEATEIVHQNVLLRVKQDNDNYTYWSQNIANSKFSIHHSHLSLKSLIFPTHNGCWPS